MRNLNPNPPAPIGSTLGGSSGDASYFSSFFGGGSNNNAPSATSMPSAAIGGGGGGNTKYTRSYFQGGGGGAADPAAAAEEGDGAMSYVSQFAKDFGTRTGLMMNTDAPPADLKEPSYTDEFSEMAALSAQQRLMGFLMCIAMGIVFVWIAMAFVPTIALFPKKFAFFFTCGNAFLVVAPAFLVGFKSQVQSMMVSHRAQVAGLYVGSTFMTLFSALYLHSSILSVAFAVVQVGSVIWYGMSFIPFARRVLSTAFNYLGFIIKPALMGAAKMCGHCCSCICSQISK